MNTPTLKNTPLFPLGLGAMPLSLTGRPTRRDAISVIEKFIATGGNLIDTADVYGFDDADRGHNEKLIRQALQLTGAEERVIVATKGGATRPNGGWEFRGGGDPHRLRKNCEQSLKNLNREQHELYYLHGPDPEVPFTESLGELIRLKAEGKINHIGIANVTLEHIQTAFKLTPLAAVQNRCNVFCKTDLYNGVIEFCEKNQLLYVPYCPLGGWIEHQKFADSRLFSPLIKKYGVTSYEISLAWLLQQSSIMLPIPGMDQVNQVATNFNALTLTIDTQDLKSIALFPDLYSPIHIEK